MIPFEYHRATSVAGRRHRRRRAPRRGLPRRRHQPRRPHEARRRRTRRSSSTSATSRSRTSTCCPTARCASAPTSATATSPPTPSSAAATGARPRPALRRIRPAAQPRHHRGQPAAAHPLRLLPGRHHALQQARRPAPAAPQSAATSATTPSSAPPSTASPSTPPTWPSRWPRSTPQSSTSTPTVNTACRSRDSTDCPATGPTATPTCPRARSSPPSKSRRHPSGARSTYRKVRDRASYAFALTSVAAELVIDDGTVTLGPHRTRRRRPQTVARHRAEEALTGQPATEDTFRRAADDELAQAEPLPATSSRSNSPSGAIVATLSTLAEGQQR